MLFRRRFLSTQTQRRLEPNAAGFQTSEATQPSRPRVLHKPTQWAIPSSGEAAAAAGSLHGGI